MLTIEKQCNGILYYYLLLLLLICTFESEVTAKLAICRLLISFTGLDPAGPYFTGTDAEVHLDKTDAEYVDIVHTNMPLIGTSDHVGHTDFFPNGGSLHPGCLNDLSGEF